MEHLFGGVPVVLGEDFAQILPVVPDGNRAATTDASIERCFLWPSFKKMFSTQNMRVRLWAATVAAERVDTPDDWSMPWASQGICIGTWRDSPSPNPADKQVVIAWISNTGRFNKELVDYRLDGTLIDPRHRHGKRRGRLEAVGLLERYLDIAFETPFEEDPEGVLKNAIAREWQQTVEDRGW
ncbi:MAG: hypothetical protein M1816_003414 [Peltula sp. TS41687]|nr:MAG: hypothetical protein M1816_003414 [Peltula sp. TS41687]